MSIGISGAKGPDKRPAFDQITDTLDPLYLAVPVLKTEAKVQHPAECPRQKLDYLRSPVDRTNIAIGPVSLCRRAI